MRPKTRQQRAQGHVPGELVMATGYAAVYADSSMAWRQQLTTTRAGSVYVGAGVGQAVNERGHAEAVTLVVGDGTAGWVYAFMMVVQA